MTAPDPAVGEGIVRALLADRLIACGNIVPGVRSVYRWKGEVEVDDEVLVVMKTVPNCVEDLTSRAVELHPYDVPELLVQEVTDGSLDYLEWVENECR